MKKSKTILLVIILISIAFSFTPSVIPQVGTYTFHGTAGNEKILEVRTANNSSLEDLFGVNYVTIMEQFFGSGCLVVGANRKSLITGVNFSAKFDPSTYSLPGLGIFDVTTYNTSNWGWTTGEFSSTPDSIGDIVMSFYVPADLTIFVNAFYDFYLGTPYNISTHTAGAHLAQLPTPVEQYLGALVWEPGWENYANTIKHNALAGDLVFPTATQYLENCTEIWEYDPVYGIWIGYKILDDENNTIYEFNLSPPKILPGFFILDSDADQPIDDDGAFSLSWTASSNANNYSLYESSSLISEINENVVLLVDGLENDPYPLQKNHNGTYYYIVVAFNTNGNRSSNCLEIIVRIPTEPNQNGGSSIDFGMYFLYISLVTITVIIISIKKGKKKYK